MPGESMMNADGEVLVGADGLELVSDEGDACAECCGGSKCPTPPPMPHCASWYLPIGGAPSQRPLIRVKEPDPYDPAERVRFRMTAQATATRAVSGYTPGSGAISAYRLYAADDFDRDNNTVPHWVYVYPVWYRDEFGCGRVQEWRGPCVIVYKRWDGSPGGEVNACLHVALSEQGLYWWVDQSATCTPEPPADGEYICEIRWSGNPSLDTVNGGSMATDGVANHRCPLVGGMLPPTGVWEGTWTGSMIGGGPFVDEYCPVPDPGRVFDALPGDRCNVQHVVLPSKYRSKAIGTARYTEDSDEITFYTDQNGNPAVDHRTLVRTETASLDRLTEVRRAGTPEETTTGHDTLTLDYTWVTNGGTPWIQHFVIQRNVFDFAAYLTNHAMIARGFMLNDNGTGVATDYYSENLAPNVWLPAQFWNTMPCAGRVVDVRTSGLAPLPVYTIRREWTWQTSIDPGKSLTLTASYRESRTVQPNNSKSYLVKLNIGHDITLTVNVEPLEGEGLCNTPPMVPPMPPVRTLAEAGALVGRLLRGEM